MKKIQQWLKKNKVEEVEAIIPDYAGTARGKFVPTERYIADEGMRLAEAIFAQTISGSYTDLIDDTNPTDVDMAARPVFESIRMVPWAKVPTAQIIHDCLHLDGSYVETAPRYVLQRVLEMFDTKNWQAVVAPELEFYLTKANTDSNQPLQAPVGRSGRQEKSRRSFSIDAVNEYEELIDTIFSYAEQQGLAIETLTHEDGIAQLEVNFLHGDPMSLADQVFAFKRTVREAAYKYDIYATFMAKPYQDQPGSSMHLHQSVLNKKSGNNIFVGKNGKTNKLFKSYIGGLQKYTPALMAFYAPNVNSYRRITPYYSAPINTQWGIDNRTVGLRVPLSATKATRVENRIAGADSNPYLAIAASLISGYLGVQEKLTPTAEQKGSAYDLDISLPMDMDSSLKLMKRSTAIRKALGKDFIQLYLAVKELEHQTFSQVITPWEREHLLLRV
ncbi:MAG: glutamine synthetase [Gammaproteobacteria bacterium]|nr:glutamine synthetase [Gammaproteobacteria bacterium]